MLPAGLAAVAAEKGEDCRHTCAAAGRTCAADGFASINTCDHLRAHFECEAGCGTAAAQDSAPAYVAFAVPKGQFPSMCFTAAANAKPTCDTSSASLLRLCPCSASS